jgi:hypothetical protein
MCTERRRTMKTRGISLSKGLGKLFLVTRALTLLLAPLPTVGAEREGTVLFFSLEDLKKELSRPELAHLYPNFAWHTRQETDDQEGPIEHNYRWGNGLGLDGYTRPGTRPL